MGAAAWRVLTNRRLGFVTAKHGILIDLPTNMVNRSAAREQSPFAPQRGSYEMTTSGSQIDRDDGRLRQLSVPSDQGSCKAELSSAVTGSLRKQAYRETSAEAAPEPVGRVRYRSPGR